jgi:hypothetical protein
MLQYPKNRLVDTKFQMSSISAILWREQVSKKISNVGEHMTLG